MKRRSTRDHDCTHAWAPADDDERSVCVRCGDHSYLIPSHAARILGGRSAARTLVGDQWGWA